MRIHWLCERGLEAFALSIPFLMGLFKIGIFWNLTHL